MKHKPVEDERVVAQKRKIGSDAFQILFCALILSVLIQQFFFDAPFSQYAVESILTVGGACYVLLRHFLAGNTLFPGKGGQGLVFLNSLVCGLMMAAINLGLNRLKWGTDLGKSLFTAGLTFLFAALFVFLLLEPVYLVNLKKQKRLEQQLDEDEGL